MSSNQRRQVLRSWFSGGRGRNITFGFQAPSVTAGGLRGAPTPFAPGLVNVTPGDVSLSRSPVLCLVEVLLFLFRLFLYLVEVFIQLLLSFALLLLLLLLLLML